LPGQRGVLAVIHDVLLRDGPVKMPPANGTEARLPLRWPGRETGKTALFFLPLRPVDMQAAFSCRKPPEGAAGSARRRPAGRIGGPPPPPARPGAPEPPRRPGDPSTPGAAPPPRRPHPLPEAPDPA